MNNPVIDLGSAKVFAGSCLDVLPTLADDSVDAIVTDPPYELGFMGKSWDNSGIAYNVDVWRECLRVLKPGGHILAFGGSRTWHRLAVAIEDAGFEMRDSIAWLYGSGFPKSHNISIAIDKQSGAMGHRGKRFENSGLRRQGKDVPDPTGIETHKPITDEAKQWDGWGTALKPAHEPIVVARKPLIGTVAENVLQHGVGGLNIDACRIGTETRQNPQAGFIRRGRTDEEVWHGVDKNRPKETVMVDGRWPANIILDEYTAELLDEQSEASRFFYVAKANKRDRNEGLDQLPETQMGRNQSSLDGGKILTGSGNKRSNTKQNFHPTVKPTSLMQYLIRLVTPENGIVLDPFTGSGSTGKAAILENKQFIGIELTEEYLPIIEGRLKHAQDKQEKEQEDDLFASL